MLHPYTDCSSQTSITFEHHHELALITSRLMLAMLRLSRHSFISRLTCIVVLAFFRIMHDRRISFSIVITFIAMFITLVFGCLRLIVVILSGRRCRFVTFILTFTFVGEQNYQMFRTLIFMSWHVDARLS